MDESSTFGSFFGLYSNSFYGNIGRSVDVNFLRRFEPINYEKQDEKKINRLNRHEEMNLQYFQAKKQKLVSKYDQYIEALRYKDKSTQPVLLKKLFEKFQKELLVLQEQYDIQHKTIVESHINDINNSLLEHKAFNNV